MKKIKGFVNFIFSFQFSKLIILFETAIVFYLTINGVELAHLCIINNFSGGLPWITTMLSCAWAAYGVSVSFYYGKSGKEQVAKIEKFGVESPVVGMETGDKPTI